MKLFFLGGVNGVGKSTVMRQIEDSNFGTHTKVIEGSTLLMQKLGIAKGDYDALRTLSEDIKTTVFANSVKQLSQTEGSIPGIITGHYVKIVSGKIIPSYGPWYQYYNGIMLLHSSPRTIALRVMSDEHMGVRVNRRLFNLRQLTLKKKICLFESAQNLSRHIVEVVSQEFGIPHYIIENVEGVPNIAAKRILQIVQSEYNH